MESNLRQFLTKKMKMTGPYQPMVIKRLLVNGGKATLNEIAKELSARDPQSIEYFEKRLKVYPKKVLKSHDVAELNGHEFILIESDLSKIEAEQLIQICEEKLESYYAKLPEFDELNDGWGRKRILLIEKHPYCSLCGARPTKNSEVELDIDHIMPTSKGGSDDFENLQVLCHRCNRAKGNHLLKSSKEVHSQYLRKDPTCIFCEIKRDRSILYENDYILAFEDKFPVSKGHTLIVPKRHIESALELTDVEMVTIFQYFKERTEWLKKNDNSIKGFNAGFNIGEAGGQTIFHAHFHVIPRRIGDTENPKGGIRCVLPEKQRY